MDYQEMVKMFEQWDKVQSDPELWAEYQQWLHERWVEKEKSKPPLINPKSKEAFKQIFSKEENKPLLISFLNAALRYLPHQYITSISVNNPVFPSEGRDQISVLATTKKGVQLNLGIQFSNEREDVAQTRQYASDLVDLEWSRFVVEKNMNQTHIITILNYYEFFESPRQYANAFQFVEDESDPEPLTDLLGIHFFVLPKVVDLFENGKAYLGGDPLVTWLLAFIAHQDEDILNALKNLEEDYPGRKLPMGIWEFYEQWKALQEAL